MNRLLSLTLLLFLLPTGTHAQILGTLEQFDGFGRAVATGDFDGDGADDLAVGVPFELVSGVADAGAVNVLYGVDGFGLSDADNQFWHQNVSGINDQAEAGDHFGWTLASGDFDGDGFDDLAVGLPFENIGAINLAGAVQILYGTSSGLSATGDQVWHQDVSNVNGTAENGDQFGWALAAGDFDNDGRDDLAIGVPYEEVNGVGEAGAVNVLYGTASGLSATGDQVWHQDITGIADTIEGNDNFGFTLAAGDFDNDGRDDLAIGVPLETLGTASNAGAAHVIYGTNAGLSATGDQFWHQDTGSVQGIAHSQDQFSQALSAGDFDGDGRDDLAIGVPGEMIDAGNVINAGAVNVLYGTNAGLSATDNQLWYQDLANINNFAQVGDRFGSALATGDFDGDGRDDLAIGVPGEDVDGEDNAGIAQILYSSSSGLNGTGDQTWNQNRPDIADQSDSFDSFGFALAAGNFDGDGRSDLAIAVPFERVNGSFEAGAANVLYGLDTDGLDAEGNQFVHQGASLPPPPPTTLNLTATASTLLVSPGQSVTFNYTIDNNTNSDATGDLFFVAERNGNTVAQGIIVSGTLQAGQSISGSFVQQVPLSTPEDVYDYALNIGLFPGTVVDAESFQIVVGAPQRTASEDMISLDWPVTDATPWSPTKAAEDASDLVATSRADAALSAYPNPFQGTTRLGFSLDVSADVRLTVYDVLGRQVALLMDGEFPAGHHAVDFDAAGLPAGAYVVRLETGTTVQTRRLVRLR